MKREYFYKENEVVKPYHYCSECGKQYKDDQLDKEIINIGSRTTPIKYCRTPCLELKQPKPVLKKAPELESLKDVKESLKELVVTPEID